ncbi:metallophosphoesterase [Pseudoalteromonas sp. MMG007]|uniref:metallophosphoesterase family protein n=1 Tax=Pseudoalteromonas sp. MMG007 TaxID=2822684 RepID=UPI001B38F656|nr:metallophosphoesterase [Pseudoalteromonas sp. MMG007]
MRFLILSDLHATFESSEVKNSRLVFENTESEFGTRFIQYCKSLNFHFDFLVCPGDISNQGCGESFKSGWKFLNEVSHKLNIKEILCVPGNHDLQSRPESNFSPLHTVKFCEPNFPSTCYETNTHFWGWNWGHIETENFNCILLNSSAYHGFSSEYKHGRVAPETTKQLSEFITSDKFKQRTFNVLLCHHHPVKREDIDFDSDHDVMDGGQALLNELEKVTSEPWLIIHGHKHFASIFRAQSAGFNAPLIFSAGSFSAKLYPKIESRTSNQFYILDIDLKETLEKDCLVGTFEAHSWNIENNWHPSSSDNLPYKGGFGTDIKPRDIITKLKELLAEDPYLDESSLQPIYEMLTHYTPTEFKELLQKLTKLNFEYDISDNKLIQVALKK